MPWIYFYTCFLLRVYNFRKDMDVEMSDAPPAPAPAAVDAGAAPVVEAASAVVAAAPVSDDGKVMADSGVSATVSVSLHPLVIMNISEHWTRYCQE